MEQRVVSHREEGKGGAANLLSQIHVETVRVLL